MGGVRAVAAVVSLLILVSCGEAGDDTVTSPAPSPAATTAETGSTIETAEPTATDPTEMTTDEPTAATEATSATEPITTSGPPSSPPPATAAAGTNVTTATTPTIATTAAPTTTLPGEPVDWLRAGTSAQVAGVAVGQTFVVRSLPGDDQPVGASLPPLTELVMTGNGRDIDQGSYTVTWAEVTGGGATGWIPTWSLVYLAAPRDLTGEAVVAFGHVPSAPTMLELGALVMDELASLDPGSGGARLVRASEPSVDPVSAVVYEMFPGETYGDDAAIGARYTIVGRQVPTGDDRPASDLEYELVSVEVRTLCTRGVDEPTGYCV